MPREKRQNLAETDRGSYCNQEEWLEEFLDNKGAFHNVSESEDSENHEENYFREFYRKTPMLEFLFNKVSGF